MASILQSFGVKAGDRVSIATENHPNYCKSICGIFAAGAVFSPLNPAYTESESKVTKIIIYLFTYHNTQ